MNRSDFFIQELKELFGARDFKVESEADCLILGYSHASERVAAAVQVGRIDIASRIFNRIWNS